MAQCKENFRPSGANMQVFLAFLTVFFMKCENSAYFPLTFDRLFRYNKSHFTTNKAGDSTGMAKKALRCLPLMALLLIYISSPVSAAAMDKPALRSETAILMDGVTGQILFEKEMHRRMFPASITKIMTALLAL